MTPLELVLLACFVLAGLCHVFRRSSHPALVFSAALVPATGFVWGLQVMGSVVGVSRPWVAEWGIEWSFRMDGWGWLFWQLICGIGTGVLLYSSASVDRASLNRLAAPLLAFMGSMLGLVTAANVPTLFLFWELTTVTSFLLIGLKGNEEARSSARTSLLVTGFGGLALLVGLALLSIENGTMDLAGFTSASGVAVAFVAIGCFAKSAQVPFHFWLPKAMVAPTPVSAYLHSATMVKAGVFLLIRLSPAMGEQVWITSVGCVTMALASVLAVLERDSKRMLAWTTVATLGCLTALAGKGTEAALSAAVGLVIAHALYKSALFFLAGGLENLTGTRDVTLYGRVFGQNRLLGAGLVAAGLSMASIPPTFGFLAKEVVGATWGSALEIGCFVVFGASSVAVAVALCFRTQFGAASGTPGPVPMLISAVPLVPAIVGLWLGIDLSTAGGLLSMSTVGMPFGPGGHLAHWHGLTTALGMTVIAWAAGTVAGLSHARLAASGGKAAPFGDQGLLDAASLIVHKLGTVVSDIVKVKSFRQHISFYFLAFVVLSAYVFVLRPLKLAMPAGPPSALNETMVAAFALVAAMSILVTKTRLGAVAVLGIVGVALSVTYVTFSAPDLALTQILVDVLTVVLFVLVFARLPRFTQISVRGQKVRDWLLAASVGIVMTVLVVAVTSSTRPNLVSNFYAMNSYTRAKGHNVVNTVIVDFRGLDTLGEITVLGIAALGVHTLVRLNPRKRDGVKA